MNIAIRPGALQGSVAAIPSKSDAHRLLVASALAHDSTKLHIGFRSADIDATISCLRALHAPLLDKPDSLTVFPIQKLPINPVLDCGESGTTLRLLMPVAAALCERVSFTGRGRLPERPVSELLACLRAHGVTADAPRLPFTLTGKLHIGTFEIAGDISSQYISGLLFALPLLAGDSELLLSSPLQSEGYASMTLAVLARFGVRAERTAQGYFVPGKQSYRSPGIIDVEGDWSNAAFFLAAGALGNGVSCTGLSQFSAQPDRAMLELLRRFGAEVACDAHAVTVSPSPLAGIVADVSQTPDLLPILAVLGSVAGGETRLVNARRLRLKESDRLAATANMLRALGARVRELPDSLIVTGGTLTGGSVDCCNDHRIAMAAAIAASVASGTTTLCGAECVNKSYPSFFEEYADLGGNIHVL